MHHSANTAEVQGLWRVELDSASAPDIAKLGRRRRRSGTPEFNALDINEKTYITGRIDTKLVRCITSVVACRS